MDMATTTKKKASVPVNRKKADWADRAAQAVGAPAAKKQRPTRASAMGAAPEQLFDVTVTKPGTGRFSMFTTPALGPKFKVWVSPTMRARVEAAFGSNRGFSSLLIGLADYALTWQTKRALVACQSNRSLPTGQCS